MQRSPNAGRRRVIDIAVHRFASFDGASIAWRELGEGPPAILLHGLFSHGEMNWLRFGHAQAVAAAGFRVILPDFRAHGQSAAPHDPADYPDDVLALDVEALIAHLDLSEYDLGGYSLGARTTVRLIARGATPRRAVLGGMGLEGIARGLARRDFFRDAIARRGQHKPGTGAWYSVQFARSTGTDLDAAVHLLGSFADTDLDELAAISMPTLVVCGADDRDNGSAPALAAALPQAMLVEIPGTHITAVSRPGLGTAIAAFLLGGTTPVGHRFAAIGEAANI